MKLFAATALLICSTSFVSAGSSLRGLDKQDNEDQNSHLANAHRNLQGNRQDRCSKIRDSCTDDNGCCGALQCNNFDNTCLPPGLNSAEQSEPIEFNVDDEAESEFRPAREGDIRGPCPAINTLANHGFINRDGKDVKVSDLAQALQDIYRVSGTTLTNGPINSAMNFHLLTEDGDGNTVLTIDQLFQNKDSTEEQTLNPNREVGTEAQEHDSSFFREDSDLRFDEPPSARLIGKFFEANDGLSLDVEEVMEYQRMRVKESCDRHASDDPQTTRPYAPAHRGGMAIQGALLFALGQAQRAQTGQSFGGLSSNLRMIVGNEQLPLDYDPPQDMLLTFAGGCASDDLRDAFRVNVEQAICDFCSELECAVSEEVVEPFTLQFPLRGEC